MANKSFCTDSGIIYQLAMLTLVAAGVMLPFSSALLCSETGQDGVSQTLTNCTDCPYCVAAVSVMEAGRKAVSTFATNNQIDDLSGVHQVFQKAEETKGMYDILSMCVLEKYTIGGLQPEYMFRCFCNRPGCNKAVTLVDYLEQLQVRDMLRQQSEIGV